MTFSYHETSSTHLASLFVSSIVSSQPTLCKYFVHREILHKPKTLDNFLVVKSRLKLSVALLRIIARYVATKSDNYSILSNIIQCCDVGKLALLIYKLLSYDTVCNKWLYPDKTSTNKEHECASFCKNVVYKKVIFACPKS